MKVAIEIKDLSVVFPSRNGPVTALNNLNLEIKQGQVTGFLGPNGAGKTTTMHVLLGFIKATSGYASIFGEDVQKSIARNRIGYLAEHPDTYRFMTGREVLKMTGHLFLLKGKVLKARIDEVLQLTGIEDAANRRIATYSRGMMQRICMAQALINDPDLLILDEPTGGLDPIGRQAVRNIISNLREQGKTVFFSSHELSEVELICDQLVILAKGSVVATGKADELIKPGENLEQYFMNVIREKDL
ncbi:MAG: ABC transporter ATP-binding protein [Kiritimatiellae bacterium]|nr:ABC transporter ATP-binding protein [Kiritimatiellia bacterium]